MSSHKQCFLCYSIIALLSVSIGVVIGFFVWRNSPNRDETLIGSQSIHRLNARHFEVYETKGALDEPEGVDNFSLWGTIESLPFSIVLTPKGLGERNLKIRIEDETGTSMSYSADLRRGSIVGGEREFAIVGAGFADAVKYWDFDGDGLFDLLYEHPQDRRTIISRSGCPIDVAPRNGQSIRGPYGFFDEKDEYTIEFKEGKWQTTKVSR